MTSEQWASTRRGIALMLVPVIAVLNKKIGFDISDIMMLGIDLAAAVYIGFSNWKSIQQKRLAPESVPALLATAAPSRAMPASVPAPTFVVESGAPAKPATLDPIKTVTP